LIPLFLCLGLFGFASVDLLDNPFHSLLQTLASLGGTWQDLPSSLTQFIQTCAKKFSQPLIKNVIMLTPN
jgi:hypothetical protein